MANDAGRNYVPKKPGLASKLGGTLAVLAICLVAGGLVLAHNSMLRRQAEQIELGLQQGPRVLVTRVRMAPTQRTLEVPGSTIAYQQSPVYAKLPGYLKAIYVDKGDRVKRDQLLAILSSPETDKQVAQAEADYHLQQTTDHRYQSLINTGVIARQTADESHAAMLRAHAAYLQLKAQQAYEVIRAPFEGMVTARNADPGTLIPQATGSAPGMPLLVVSTLKPLRVYAQVPQSDALFIHEADRAVVTVTELPQRQFTGSVARISHALTDTTRTMLVEVDLPNDDLALLPGMYATLQFAIRAPAGIPLVPDGALVFKHGRTYVPVIRAGHLRLVEVVLGYDDGENVQILSGLHSDEMVAINIGQAAQDGEAVQPVPVKPD